MQRVSTRVLSLSVLLLCVTIPGVASAQDAGRFETFRGTVTKVVDGDTIRFLPDGSEPGTKAWPIRMVTVDTPETHLPGPGGVYSQGYWGDAATAQLARLVKVGETVEVDSYGLDKYGRVLGRVYKRGGVDVNLKMVASGWGSLYVICDGHSCDLDPNYRAACQYAMRNETGIFDPARPLPELPFIFRSIHQKRPLSKFVGNITTKEYVQPSEWEKVPLCDRVFFMTQTDARREGYSPAR